MIVSVWTNLVGKDNTRLALSTDTGNLRLAVSYMDDRYQQLYGLHRSSWCLYSRC